MYPSCSNYGLKTFNETNFTYAFILASGRLLRCGHDHKNYSITLQKNGFKYLDYPSYDTPPKDLYYVGNAYYFSYSDTIRDDSTLLFIKTLINNHYYQEALLEIMRIEFVDDMFNIELFINKVICLKALDQYEKALFEYETKCPIEYKSNTELAFQIALIHYQLQNFDISLNFNDLSYESCIDTFCKHKRILLNGLLFANKNEWQKSLISYQLLSKFKSYNSISNANIELTQLAINQKDKNTTLAGILSIIPGAGYAYSGHKQTAISAFLVNGLLAYATYSNFKNENYGISILTSVFSLSFYIGNIFGAAKSAKRFNEQQKNSIINKLEFNSHF